MHNNLTIDFYSKADLSSAMRRLEVTWVMDFDAIFIRIVSRRLHSRCLGWTMNLADLVLLHPWRFTCQS